MDHKVRWRKKHPEAERERDKWRRKYAVTTNLRARGQMPMRKPAKVARPTVLMPDDILVMDRMSQSGKVWHDFELAQAVGITVERVNVVLLRLYALEQVFAQRYIGKSTYGPFCWRWRGVRSPAPSAPTPAAPAPVRLVISRPATS